MAVREDKKKAEPVGNQPLPADVASSASSALGNDFSNVQVAPNGQGGASASDLAYGMSAAAYTTGNDVHFGAGQQGQSQAGNHLIAHELTHVVQQGDAAQQQKKEKQ